MNIERLNPHGGDSTVNRSQQPHEAVKSEESTTGAARPRRDQVSLSQKARDLEAAMRAVQDAPDVREDKVAAIRKQLEEGTYTVSDEDLAKAMLSRLSASEPGT